MNNLLIIGLGIGILSLVISVPIYDLITDISLRKHADKVMKEHRKLTMDYDSLDN